jgi:hypothetical protein
MLEATAEVTTQPLLLERLPLVLSPEVDATLNGWLKAYFTVHSSSNGIIETGVAGMLPALLEERNCHECWIRTTQDEWISGTMGFAFYFQDVDLRLEGGIRFGRAIILAAVTHPAPPAFGQRWMGIPIRFKQVDVLTSGNDPDMEKLVNDLRERSLERWLPFAGDLQKAVDADAADEEQRAERLTSDFEWDGTYRLNGERERQIALLKVDRDVCLELVEGEWIVLLDEKWRERGKGAVIETYADAGKVILKVNGDDLPHKGKLQPLVRTKIIEQKRAIISELCQPTGAMTDLVRLMVNPRSVIARKDATPGPLGNPKVKNNRSQMRAVRLALGMDPGELLVIQGPPGTGKSTTAAEIIHQLLLRDPRCRILVASHSNHGVDVLLSKCIPYISASNGRIRPARVGKRERLSDESRVYFIQPGTPLDGHNLVFTTCDSLALQDAAGAATYDYVFLDEANRATILDSLLVLARGRRFILIGDDMQLPPVISEVEQAMVNGDGDSVITSSLLHWLIAKRCGYVLLETQNRMHPEIGDLVSRTFYGGRIRNGRAVPTKLIATWLHPKAAYWVDTATVKHRRERRGQGTSLYNRTEADVVHSLLVRLLNGTPQHLSIGVITTYADQRDLLRRRLSHINKGVRTVMIDTVDSFEGRECDIVIVSMVRSNGYGEIGFLKKEQRINVALSRARRLLIMVGDTSTLLGGYFEPLLGHLRAAGAVLDATELSQSRRCRNGRKYRSKPPSKESSSAGTAADESASPLADLLPTDMAAENVFAAA